jgi:chromosome segregation ATPase
MSGSLSLLMDVLVLAGLGATIFYALKLSRSLDNFKKSRQEFSNLIFELSSHIETANRAIENLKQASLQTGESLNRVVKEGKYLADELDLMNKAGNSLAQRLETLAEKNRRIAQGLDVYEDEAEPASAAAPQKPAPRAPQNDAGPSFFIQDRDYGDEDDTDFNDDEGDLSGLQSQAERELFEALKGKKRSSNA